MRKNFPRTDVTRLFNVAWREAALAEDASSPGSDSDARLIATVAGAGVNLFVTGDKRVLRWSRSPAMRIVSPRDAWITLFAPHLLR